MWARIFVSTFGVRGVAASARIENCSLAREKSFLKSHPRFKIQDSNIENTEGNFSHQTIVYQSNKKVTEHLQSRKNGEAPLH
jgi:hypothetical protein